jgi:CRP-like cAMP-binding protein
MPENLFLKSLPPEVRETLTPFLEPVDLEQEFLCYGGSTPVRAIYFPEGGMVSLVAVSEQGDMIEGTVVGVQGLVGIPAVLNQGHSRHMAMVQVAGRFLKMDVDRFQEEMMAQEPLQRAGLSYTLTVLDEIAQSALCNRVHNLSERLARWLLLTRDAIQADTLPLTQEFISYMLGVRRSGVTVAASALQEEGTITYTRGRIRIIERDRLEESACSCYSSVRSMKDSVLCAR